MKNYLLIFIFLLSGLCYGQFTVSDSSENWEKIGNVSAHTMLYQKKDKSTAKIEYRDFTQLLMGKTSNLDFSYYEFTFSTSENTISELYQIMKDHFISKKVESITLEFPEGNMILEFSKSLGNFYLNLKFDKANTLIDKGEKSLKTTGSINEKQLEKLFGKKK